MGFHETRNEEDAIKADYLNLLTEAGISENRSEIDAVYAKLDLGLCFNYESDMFLSIWFETETSEEFRHNIYQKCVETLSGKKFVRECNSSYKVSFEDYFKTIDSSGKYMSLLTQCQDFLNEICKSGIQHEELSKFILDHLSDFEGSESECEEFYYDSLEQNSEYACNECFEQFLQNAYDCVEILREIDQVLPEGAVIDGIPSKQSDNWMECIEFSGGSVIVELPTFTVDDCIALEDWPAKARPGEKLSVGGFAYIYDLSYNSTLTVNGQSFDVSKQYSSVNFPRGILEKCLYYKGMEQVIKNLDSKIEDIINEMSTEYGKQMSIQYLFDDSFYGSGSGKDNSRTRTIEVKAYDEKMFKKFTESNFRQAVESRVNELSETITNDVILINDDIPKLGYQKEYEMFTEACELLCSMLLDDDDDPQLILSSYRSNFGHLERRELYTDLVQAERLDHDNYDTKKLQRVIDMLNECAAKGIQILKDGQPYVNVPNAEVVIKPKFKYAKTVRQDSTIIG